MVCAVSLQWHHNGRNGVSKHWRLDCLLNRLFRCRSKKTSKLRVTGLCEGNSPVTGEFPAQRACYAENVSIWWRHHICAVCLAMLLWHPDKGTLTVLSAFCVTTDGFSAKSVGNAELLLFLTFSLGKLLNKYLSGVFIPRWNETPKRNVTTMSIRISYQYHVSIPYQLIPSLLHSETLRIDNGALSHCEIVLCFQPISFLIRWTFDHGIDDKTRHTPSFDQSRFY